MIKYVELTAPEASAFRQAKILSVECQEGDQIKEGDTLFRVQSGAFEVNLPATKTGKVVELIAVKNENITLSTALLLLEMEVDGSTASTPISNDDDLAIQAMPQTKAQPKTEPASEATPKPSKSKTEPGSKPSEAITTKQSSPEPKKRKRKAKRTKTSSKQVKQHTQQSLDLGGEGISAEPEEQQSQDNSNAIEQTSQAMSANSITQITVPDIGADSAKVIDILVSVGDTVVPEDPLVTLESDKASMDVPSTHSGVVHSISVHVDQDVSEGTVLIELDSGGNDSENDKKADVQAAANSSDSNGSSSNNNEVQVNAPATSAKPAGEKASSTSTPVMIPDIGGDSAKVIEILVAVGDEINVEDSLVTLESDKASMEVPSSVAGRIESIEVSVDQDVSEGSVVVIIASTNDNELTEQAAGSEKTDTQADVPAKPATTPSPVKETVQPATLGAPSSPQGKSHASPSIRRFARELGVDLSRVSGSGRKGRVTETDVKKFVKGALSHASETSSTHVQGGSGIPAVPAQDFSKFGEIDVQPLNKIKRLTAENLHRSWLNVPHVTHHDESNISDLEEFRKQLNDEYKRAKQDTKLSPLAFIVKAVVSGLRKYPQFNASLEPGGANLIYKKYFNIGIAVETPNGLVVPVVKDADKKSVGEIAKEMGELAAKARDKKLTMADMSGACITISSLGGIGGTSFTPIVNTPEVAILGVSRSKVQPVWNGKDFEPGMVLPLSLSYDHRVIDGAEAARFTRHIAAVLEDVRRLTV